MQTSFVEIPGPFCGNTSPDIVTITGNIAHVIFKSDGSTVYPGFLVDWSALIHCKIQVFYKPTCATLCVLSTYMFCISNFMPK